MAPSPESFYLPPLDSCLRDGHEILSWKTAFEALTDPSLVKSSPNLELFLLDPLSIRAIASDFGALESSSPQSKSDFETRTAEINATPSNNGQFNTEQIKEDALWISKQAGISETLALRIVLLEWQNRPATRILESYSEEEIISITQAAGNAELATLSSTLRPRPSRAEANRTLFDADDSRHGRLLQMLLSEQEHLLGVIFTLQVAHGLACPKPPPGRAYGVEKKPMSLPWIKDLMAKVMEVSGHNEAGSQTRQPSLDFLPDGCKALERLLQGWEFGTKWTSTLNDAAAIDVQYRDSQLRQMFRVLQILVVRNAALDGFSPAASIQSWFEFVNRYGFLELLIAHSPAQESFVRPIQALVSLISLQLLRLPHTMAYLNNPTVDRRPPIIHDRACRAQIDETIRTAATRLSPIASLAMFAWSLIFQDLRNRINLASEDSNSEDEGSFTDTGSPSIRQQLSPNIPAGFVEALESVTQTSPEGDPIAMYAKVAVDECSVLNVISILSGIFGSDCETSANQRFGFYSRLTLLELARQALYVVEYHDEIMACFLAILEGGEDSNLNLLKEISTRSELATVFMHDNDVLVPRLLHPAYRRYPYEMAPLLKLSKALVRPILSSTESFMPQPLCDQTPIFTMQLPSNFSGYELVREEENANGVRLTEDLRLISHRQYRGSANAQRSQQLPHPRSALLDSQGEFFIPRGTTGAVISESRPFVVAWDHMHSPLRYLACLLSTTTPSSDVIDIFREAPLDPDSQSDIIFVFSQLLNACLVQESTEARTSRAMSILEEASDILDRNEDLITIVFEIFERELSERSNSDRGSTMATLTSCVYFFQAALKLIPQRIWPLLSRSKFLELSGSGGRLSTVISTENSSNTSAFVDACLSLFEALRQDIVAHAVSNRVPSTAVTTRFNKIEDHSSRLPGRITGEIMFAFAHTFTGVLQSLPNRPLLPGPKANLTSIILRTFKNILLNVYGFDDGHEASQKLCGSLAPAADYLLDSFLTPMDDSLVSSALISSFLIPNSLHVSGVTTNEFKNLKQCVGCVIDFSTTLLNIGTISNRSCLHLEQHLFRTLPLFVRLFSTDETHKSSITLLLSSLVQSSGKSASKPPSLLGHLGIENAQIFLRELAGLGGPLANEEQEIRTWDLASAVIENKQHWVASYLLTGDTPKDSLKRKASEEAGKAPRRTLLRTALDELSKVRELSSRRCLAMLNFVLHAQDYWPWVSHTIRNHVDFCTRITDYVDGLTKDLSKTESEQTTQTYASALIARILAAYLHNMRLLGDTSYVKTVIEKSNFYLENAVSIPMYNSSLHSNLKRNFEKKFPGCDLNAFKRLFGTSKFGRDYYYDLNFAASVLKSQYSQVWKDSKGRGFEDELARANSNLSLVEAQVTLFGSWKSLCAELCYSLSGDKPLQKHLINVSNRCLVANIESNLPQAIFEHLLQARAELALVILQRLLNVRCEVPSIKTLLYTVWDAIRGSGQDFEIAFTGSLTTYYRTLLRVLLLTLQPHGYLTSTDKLAQKVDSFTEMSNEARQKLIPALLEMATEVVGKGYRSLCEQVHEEQSTVSSMDFGLVIDILRHILCVRGVAEAHVQLTLRLCDTGIQRYALALFSWSDHLASKNNDDPIFGELSISCLRELSSIPPMAEFLATEGVISQLSTAAVLSRLRGPQTAHASWRPRLLHIWAAGILPLLLNLLVTVGAPLFPEALAFLDGFAPQLKRAGAALDGASTVAANLTLPAAKELHMLGMLVRATELYRESPAAAAATADGLSLQLGWDPTSTRENLEAWLQGSRAALRARIAPTSGLELELQREKPRLNGDGCESRLEERVVAELRGALRCLGGE